MGTFLLICHSARATDLRRPTKLAPRHDGHVFRQPAFMQVLDQRRQATYARRDPILEQGESPAEKNVATAAKPPQAIPGGLPGPGLLAQVISSK